MICISHLRRDDALEHLLRRVVFARVAFAVDQNFRRTCATAKSSSAARRASGKAPRAAESASSAAAAVGILTWDSGQHVTCGDGLPFREVSGRIDYGRAVLRCFLRVGYFWRNKTEQQDDRCNELLRREVLDVPCHKSAQICLQSTKVRPESPLKTGRAAVY